MPFWISIKENVIMEKDLKNNHLNKASQIACGCTKKISGLFDAMVARMSRFDDSSDLKTRTISGFVMFFVGILAICFFKGLFYLLVIAITILMTYEWIELTKPAKDKQKWQLIGFFYILLPMAAVLKLREIDSGIVLWMFSVICATDIFAYFAGKNFGGAKLMPSVSPNKTWSGLWGGVAASMVIGFLSSFMFSGGMVFFIFISAVLSIIEQCSDLLESKFKRTFGVKDSGNIIPGHGGVLDRFDGLMLVAPIVLLLVWFCYPSFIAK
ncbi:MAG: phosphatidate cytidylyltransferase [Rickettsiaceae bacterium]|jgi:phosphatidate cytidylyltransferase|nr:phosphatidate cytidylyltransferase [Rickettsiaceae bacterium]